MNMEHDLFWIATTVKQEAESEEFYGQLAVAYVICNRAKREGSVSDVVFRKMQFSCWNSDSPTRMRLDDLSEQPSWPIAYKAACAAYFGLLPDPTRGATHYLNERLTKQIRPGGDLPSWFDESKVTLRLGNHTFLKL